MLPDRENIFPLIYTTLLHVALGVLVVFGLPAFTTEQEVRVPDIVNAELVTMSQVQQRTAPELVPEPPREVETASVRQPEPEPEPPAPEPEPEPEPPPPEPEPPPPEPEPEPEPEPPAPDPIPAPPVEEPAPAPEPEPEPAPEPEPTPEPEPEPERPPAPSDEDIFREMEESLLSQLASESQREQQSAVQAEEERQAVNTYINQIGASVRRNWSLPPNVDRSMVTTVRLELLPNGELASVSITSSSGSSALDQSVLRAIERAAPFQVPADIRLFEREFRRFNMNFVPEV